MIRKLRLIPLAAALGLVVACGSPSAPDIPGPDPEDEGEDPKTDMRVGSADRAAGAPAGIILT